MSGGVALACQCLVRISKPEPNALASGGTTILANSSRPEASAYGSRDVVADVLKHALENATACFSLCETRCRGHTTCQSRRQEVAVSHWQASGTQIIEILNESASELHVRSFRCGAEEGMSKQRCGNPAIGKHEGVAFLQWALPRMGFRWSGFRKVRRRRYCDGLVAVS